MKTSIGLSAHDTIFLDPTFGENGKIAHSFPGTSTSHATGMAVKRNGKIIVGATTYGDAGQQFGLMSLQEDGQIDTRFGGPKANGFIRGNFLPDVSALGGSVSILKNEKILLSGFNYRTPGGYQHVLARFHEDGTRDVDFGDRGQVIIEAPLNTPSSSKPGADLAFFTATGTGSTTIQSDGKILLTIHSAITGPYGYGTLMRFETDGAPDLSFNECGYVFVRLGQLPTQIAGHALQPDGKIIVYGGAGHEIEHGFLARFTTDGKLDATFGENGFSIITAKKDSTRVLQVAVTPDGRLVAAGFAYFIPDEGLGTNDCLVMGFTKSGKPDKAFNGGIPLITQPRAGDCHWLGAVSSSEDTTTTVGATLGRGDYKSEFLIGRYLADGSLDKRFGDSVGWRMISVFGKTDEAIAYALLPNDKLLVVGNSWVTSSYAVSLIRLPMRP